MISAKGSHQYGGRWNSKGIRVVYLGTSLAQSAMELLVNIGNSKVLNSFYKMAVTFDDSLVQNIALEGVSSDWFKPSLASSVKAVGDAWVESSESLVLQVPSSAVLGDLQLST